MAKVLVTRFLGVILLMRRPGLSNVSPTAATKSEGVLLWMMGGFGPAHKATSLPWKIPHLHTHALLLQLLRYIKANILHYWCWRNGEEYKRWNGGKGVESRGVWLLTWYSLLFFLPATGAYWNKLLFSLFQKTKARGHPIKWRSNQLRTENMYIPPQ